MKAWEYEAKYRMEAQPKPYEESPPDWSGPAMRKNERKELLSMFWNSEVPGSRAPEHMFLEMIQARHNRGYDVTGAETLIPEALSIVDTGDWGELERISARVRRALIQAPKDPSHPAWTFSRPDSWEAVKAAIPGFREPRPAGLDPGARALKEKIREAWTGQIAGGAYGTALEGYTGATLKAVYGDKLNGYVHPVDTFNDDITYEIAFLKAAEEAGADLTSDHIADQWLRLIPFGWSAEFIALENLRQGIYPPESGIRHNCFSEWIGAQMRTMVCGLVAPGRPDMACALAYADGRVSHEVNGIFGGLHAAVVTALAFIENDPREVVKQSIKWMPEDTEFTHLLKKAVAGCKKAASSEEAWNLWAEEMKTYNWIHTYPNMIANVISLWFGEGDMTKAFRILGECGMDVDCNAGTVGTVLGLQKPIPEAWSAPLKGELNTYVPGYELVKIPDLAEWTWTVAGGLKEYKI